MHATTKDRVLILGAALILAVALMSLFLPMGTPPAFPPNSQSRQVAPDVRTRPPVEIQEDASHLVPEEELEIFAGGLVTCDLCGDTKSKVELRDLSSTPAKIARVLDSFRASTTFKSCDPRVTQLVALGRDAMSYLLEAYGAYLANPRGGGGMHGSAIRYALNGLLLEQDREIILTYFEHHAVFESLVLKHKYPEAGEIAMRRLRNPFSPEGRYVSSDSDVEIALTLSPSEAVPFMLQQIHERPESAYRYLAGLAENAPQVDIREGLARGLATKQSSSMSYGLVPLALERGLPEGFDAAVRVLRDQEVSFAHERILESVREYTGFAGTAEQTAQWIEQNRQRLFWSESGKRFVMR